jgi:hypothetical protein
LLGRKRHSRDDDVQRWPSRDRGLIRRCHRRQLYRPQPGH